MGTVKDESEYQNCAPHTLMSNAVEHKNPFEYQKPNDDQVRRIELIRHECANLLYLMETEIKSCRERSLAITKLEEVSMWANKAVAFEG